MPPLPIAQLFQHEHAPRRLLRLGVFEQLFFPLDSMSTISLLAVSFELDGVDLVYFLFRALLLMGLVLTEISGR